MNKIYNSISMILNTATLIWGRSLCRVWVSSLLTVLLKMIFHILTGATWAIRLPWSEISFIIHSPTSFQTFMIFFFCGTNLSGLFLTAFTFIAWTKTIESFFYGTKSSLDEVWMEVGWSIKFTPKRRFAETLLKLRWVCFIIGRDLEKCNVTLLAHQRILCSEWVPWEWESKQLIKTIIHN